MNVPYMPRAMCSASGPDMAVVKMQSEGFGFEGVGELLAGGDDPAGDHRHAVHLGGMDAVEMHGVRVLGAVHEPHAQEIALSASQRRSGILPLNVHAWNRTPGATSISRSSAMTSHSRTIRPSAPIEVWP